MRLLSARAQPLNRCSGRSACGPPLEARIARLPGEGRGQRSNEANVFLKKCRVRQFKAEVWVPLSPEEIFPFFADAENLDLITPPWLHFRIVTPRPVEMKVGTIIDYRLRLHGLPLRWRTLIKEWQPPHRFVDEQVRGPYRRWIHEHTFDPCDGRTLACDVVHYAVPLDFILHPLFVRRDIEKIFASRRESLRRRFGGKV